MVSSGRWNNRRALAEVVAAIRSGVVPRSSARRAAVAVRSAGSLRLPRCGAGARYGASVSISSRSSGTRSSERRASQLRNVIMPLHDTHSPRPRAASSTSGPALKQCSTPDRPAGASPTSRAVSASASREWITTGLPALAARQRCHANASRCRSRGE